jgi:hypothetical protein
MTQGTVHVERDDVLRDTTGCSMTAAADAECGAEWDPRGSAIMRLSPRAGERVERNQLWCRVANMEGGERGRVAQATSVRLSAEPPRRPWGPHEARTRGWSAGQKNGAFAASGAFDPRFPRCRGSGSLPARSRRRQRSREIVRTRSSVPCPGALVRVWFGPSLARPRGLEAAAARRSLSKP